MVSNDYSDTERKVSPLLAAGILFFPYVFSWFTLRSGHSALARGVSILWLLFVVLVATGRDFKQDNMLIGSNAASVENEKQKTDHKNTSSWLVQNYVDEFDDPTGERFMMLNSFVKGTFNNSATTRSPLYVLFQIERKPKVKVYIHLFEYAIKSRVKEHSITEYFINIKTKAGGKQRLAGTHTGSRIELGERSSLILHRYFSNNHEIKFYLTKDSEYDTLTSYRFKLSDYPGYKDKFKEL